MSDARVEALELDLDLRLVDLWREAEGVGEWNIKTVAAFIRAAYGAGYVQALAEDKEGRRGELCAAHGYRVP